MSTEKALRIKKIREYRDYSQDYMAKKLDISQNTYSKIEHGIIATKPARLEKIAKILNVPVEAITNGNHPLFNFEPKQEKSYTNKDMIDEVVKMFGVFQEDLKNLKEQNNEIIKALKMQLHKRPATSKKKKSSK